MNTALSMGKKKTRKKSPKKGKNSSASRYAAESRVRASTESPAAGVAPVEESEPKWGLYLVGLLIFVITTTVVVSPYGQVGGYSPDLHMAAYIQIGVLVTLFLFVVSTFFRQRIPVYRSPLLLPVLLFYAWAMLSVLWANTEYEAVLDALDWSGAFFSALLVVLMLNSIGRIRVLLFFLLISGLLMALLGIGQYLLGIDWVHQHIVPAATFANKNMAGQYGVLIFPIAVAFFLYTRNGAFAWFYAIVIALIMVYIFYVRARGAWIGFVFEVVVLAALLAYVRIRHDYRFFADLPTKRIALAVSMALFLGMSYVTPAMLGNEEKVMAASIGSNPQDLRSSTGFDVLSSAVGGAGYSANKRFTIWANSMGMFRDHFLFGVGLGNWTIHYAKYQSFFKQDPELLHNKFHANAHNDYVEILCELGIIGFALFLWVFFALFKVFLGLLTLARNNRELFLFFVCLTAALSGIALNGVFSFPLKQPIPILITLIYMAVLSNLYGMLSGRGEAYTLKFPPLPIKAATAVLVLVATVGVLVLHVGLYKSEIHYRYSMVALKKGEFEKAYQEARRAYDLNPMRNVLLWLEATALLQLGRSDSSAEIIEKLEQVERYHPYSANALVNLTAAYYNVGRYDDAADSIGRLVSVQPGNDKVRYDYAVLLLNAGRTQDSLEQLEEKILPVRENAYEDVRENVARRREAFDGDGSFLSGAVPYLAEKRNERETIRILAHYAQLWGQAMKKSERKVLPPK